MLSVSSHASWSNASMRAFSVLTLRYFVLLQNILLNFLTEVM